MNFGKKLSFLFEKFMVFRQEPKYDLIPMTYHSPSHLSLTFSSFLSVSKRSFPHIFSSHYKNVEPTKTSWSLW